MCVSSCLSSSKALQLKQLEVERSRLLLEKEQLEGNLKSDQDMRSVSSIMNSRLKMEVSRFVFRCLV